MAELDLPAVVYNWLVAFFAGHAHRTMYNDEVSSTRSILASIIQGSSLGSALYTVTAANLKPLHTNNSLVKFADDTYLVVSAECADSRGTELDNIAAWAAKNNLQLNKLKTSQCPVTAAAAGRRPRHYAESPRRHLQQQLVRV